MTTDSPFGSAKAKSTTTPSRHACFDANFFAGFLGERARALCSQQPGTTPVVLLHLADGAALDVCHVEQLSVDWMAASVYRDPKTCERMELVFLPYALITRVTVSLPSVHERRIGFQTRTSPPVNGLEETGESALEVAATGLARKSLHRRS